MKIPSLDHPILKVAALPALIALLGPVQAATTNDLALLSVGPLSRTILKPGETTPPIRYVVQNRGPDAFGSLSEDGATNAQRLRIEWHLVRADNETNILFLTSAAPSLFLRPGENYTNEVAGAKIPSEAFDAYVLRGTIKPAYYSGVLDPEPGNNSTDLTEVLMVQAPPAITEQPGSVTLLGPGPVQFGAAVRGSEPLQYQWRRDGVALAGAIQAALALSVADAGSEGGYDLVAGNPFGSVTSRVARLYFPLSAAASGKIGGRISGAVPGGEYGVVESLEVPPLEILDLQAGAHLTFSTDTSLKVQGTLQAVGESGRPVSLAPALDVAPDGWGGILLQSTTATTNRLEQVHLEGAATGVKVTTSGAHLRLTGSRITRCSAYGLSVDPNLGVYMTSNQVVVSESLLSSNKIGARVEGYVSGCTGSSGRLVLEGSEISFNQTAGVSCSGYASSMFGCTLPKTGSAYAVLESNFIHHNQTGISIAAWDGYNANGYASVECRNNLVVLNEEDGIGISGDDPSSVSVLNNTVAHNEGAGLAYKAAAMHTLLVQNNLLVRNGSGLVWQKSYTNAVPTVASNDVYGNRTNDWENLPAQFGDLSTTNSLGQSADVHGNISLDPFFVSGSDFHLSAASPVIDAGSTNQAPLFDYEGDPRDARPDLGFDEFRPTSDGVGEADVDGDGLPDVWELERGLNPWNAADALEDPDLDGLSNLDEWRHHTNPKAEDSDDDGASDLSEVMARSDPADPASVPGKDLTIAVAVEVLLPTRRGESYQLQVSTDLSDWSDVGAPVPGDGKVRQWFFPVRGQGPRFYRIQP